MSVINMISFMFVVIALSSTFVVAQPPCVAGPYDLSPIAGKLVSVVWDPSAVGTISVGICTTLDQPCGTQPDVNKCYETPTGCTSVCQSWIDQDNSPQGANLGIYTSIYEGDDGVVLEADGGDPTDKGIGRRTLINIACGTSLLNFTAFIQARADPVPPHGQPYTYMVNFTSNLVCKSRLCSKYNNCGDCTRGSNGQSCDWCLDSNTCVPSDSVKSGKCQNYIGTPDRCPNLTCSKQNTCSGCTKSRDVYGSCFWCLDGNNTCRESFDSSCMNHISNTSFC